MPDCSRDVQRVGALGSGTGLIRSCQGWAAGPRGWPSTAFLGPGLSPSAATALGSKKLHSS
jgi:hypothetical protein